MAASRGRGGSLLRPIELDDLASGRALADLADSVFAIARSTYAPDFRYVKPLKVRTGSDSDWALPLDGEVLTYQLGRVSSPHVSKGSALIPQSEGPFLGLRFLGPSHESDHLRDYAAEAEHAQRAEEKRLKRIRTRSTLIDGILDGSYARYLKD